MAHYRKYCPVPLVPKKSSSVRYRFVDPAKVSGNDSKVCIVDSQWHEVAEYLISENSDPVFMDPNLLYTLKVSHAHWDIKWDKTMSDILFLQVHGCTIHEEAYKRLLPIWAKTHGEKRANLKRSNEEFFKDGVRRDFDHDKLHELMAFNGRPMHERIRPDLKSVWCSELMFNELTREEQVCTALEELLVIAIERGHLTVRARNSEKLMAVSRAYRLLCTSMTSGWFARFLITNRFEFFNTRREQWMTQLNTALQNLPLLP